jgi:hypothetical protein
MSGTAVYSAFGLLIESELALPELPAGSGTPDVFIRKGPVPFRPATASRREQFIFHAQAGAFHIAAGRDVVVDPLEGVDSAVVRIVLLGRVMACLLWQRGWLPLHASGVAIGGVAALFVGPSGSGKSTMAAALHARGHAVITDDVGPVQLINSACAVLPTWPRLRLATDSMTSMESRGLPLFRHGVFQIDKYSVHVGNPVQEPIRLTRIYMLDFGPDFRSDPITPLLTVASLRRNSFVRKRLCDMESAKLHLKECASVAQAVPVSRLVRPKAFDSLPELARFVEEDMSIS